MTCEPLASERMVKITKRKTKKDWAKFLEEIADPTSKLRKSP